MIWFLLQKIGFFIFLILTMYFVYKRKYEGLMSLYFWGMTFTTCYYFAFTIWFPTKIITLGMIICMLVYGLQRKSLAMKFISPIVTVFIIVILISDIVGLLLPGEYASQINNFSRMFNASYTYLTTIALLFYGLMMKRGFVKRLFPSYCFAVEIAIVFGFIHFICLQVDIGFMPILRQDGSVNLEAIAQMGEQAVPRVYGVTGEPKNLGFLICPYLFILTIMLGRNLYRINKWYHILMLVIGTFILINTYSSSALINYFLVTPIVVLFLPFPKMTYKVGAILSILCICILLWVLKGELNLNNYHSDSVGNESYITQLYERTFGRAQNEIENDRQESVIFENYINEDNIINNIFGWGVSQYTFHVPDQVIGKNLIPVQSGLILSIADFGILGCFLIVIVLCSIIVLLRVSLKQKNIYSLIFSIASLSAFIGSMMFGTIVSCFVYLMLSIYAYYDTKEIENSNNYFAL